MEEIVIQKKRLKCVSCSSKLSEDIVIITADHGNVEQMFDEETGQPHTQHTTLPVPLIYIGEKKISLLKHGSLSDVAPTILTLMDLPQPKEMTGKSIVKNH